MDQNEWLTMRFEENRARLRTVAYRMLGSLSEAEDAVQESWIRLNRADTSDVENLEGWLTTVVARVCLNVLRSRKSRREVSLQEETEPSIRARRSTPEDEAVLADAVGLALLVVLDTLSPAERLAFVMHDMFAVPFNEIAPLVGRSPAATRQLASRARRRVHAKPARSASDHARERNVVDAFLAASRSGNFEALLSVLDPEITLRIDRSLIPAGAPNEIRGAQNVAGQAVAYSKRAASTRPALIDGKIGYVVAPRGRLLMVGLLKFDHEHKVITELELIADPTKLCDLEFAIL